MATMISFHVPADQALLAAVGEVALRHEHLNYILRMTIKSLTGLRIDEAIDATSYDGTRQLRERIRKLAKQRLGEGEPLLKLLAILERCRRVSDRRNEQIHSLWAKELDGEPMRTNSDNGWVPLSSTEDLLALAKETEALTTELNSARLDGFIFEALKKRPWPKD